MRRAALAPQPLVLAAAIGAVLVPHAAGASDLRDVAGLVEQEWKKAGATVERGPTRFLYDDETMTVLVPPAADLGCVSVALIGARGISFHAKVSKAEDDPLLDDAGTR